LLSEDDGLAVWRESAEYRSAGAEVPLAFLAESFGQLEFVPTSELLVSTRDAQADGVPEEKEIRYYYDAPTKLYHDKLWKVTKDEDGDNQPETTSVYNYNEQGSLETLVEDLDGDTLGDRLTLYLYYGNGLLRSEDLDKDMDGNYDSSNESFWSAEGYLVREERDADFDGVTEAGVEYTYETSGNRLTVSPFFWNREGAEPFKTYKLVTTYVYDAQNRKIEETSGSKDGGTIKSITKWRYQNGLLEQITFDTDGNGTTDQMSALFWDEYGNLLRVEHDADTSDDIPVTSNEIYDYSCWQ